MAWESPEAKHEGECLTCWTEKRVRQFFPSFKQFEDSNHPRDSAFQDTCTPPGLSSHQYLRKTNEQILPSGEPRDASPSAMSCPPCLGRRGQKREKLRQEVFLVSRENLSQKHWKSQYQMGSGHPGLTTTTTSTSSVAKDASWSCLTSMKKDCPTKIVGSTFLREPACLPSHAPCVAEKRPGVLRAFPRRQSG